MILIMLFIFDHFLYLEKYIALKTACRLKQKSTLAKYDKKPSFFVNPRVVSRENIYIWKTQNAIDPTEPKYLRTVKKQKIYGSTFASLSKFRCVPNKLT